VDILIKTLRKTAEDPQVKAALLKIGFIPSSAGPEETIKEVRKEFDVAKEIYGKVNPK
jgi:tripartite-type tricarboxylate transporter receptor subunit TctC